jgi:hypothetical protein
MKSYKNLSEAKPRQERKPSSNCWISGSSGLDVQPECFGAIFSKGRHMPGRQATERARDDRRQGKSPSTQAGEFVREEIHHVRRGKHGARSAKQAIAIGLSKARRSGVKLGAPRRGKASTRTRMQALRDLRRGRSHSRRGPSIRRSRAVTGALKREQRSAASRKSLARQARGAARVRGRTALHRAAMKAVRTKGARGRSRAARKGARTRLAA